MSIKRAALSNRPIRGNQETADTNHCDGIRLDLPGWPARATPPRYVADQAELWLHIVTRDRRMSVEEHGPAITGCRDWTRQEVTVQVPEDAELIRFGLTLPGRAEVRLRNVELIRAWWARVRGRGTVQRPMRSSGQLASRALRVS